MSNLFNYVILGITLCVAVAAGDTLNDIRKPINQTLAIEVEVDLPWFINFKIPLIENFEPLRLAVSVSRPGETRIRPVGFSAHNETEKRRVFRNSNPLRLYEGDLIYGQLGYMGDLQKPRGETELKHIEFSYVVKNKQFDTITIVVEILTDPRAKPSDEYDDEECDSVEENKTTSTPAADKQQPSTAVSCTSIDSEEGYTAELLKTAEEIGQIGTRLLLKGNNKSPGSNAVDVIKSFILDKLRLPHVAEKVLQARFINSSVLFEVATPHAKLEVLTKARLCLRKKHRIEGTELSFTDTQP